VVTIEREGCTPSAPAELEHVRQRLSCGPGAKGERLYDWALALAGNGGHLLIRWSLSSGQLAFCLCWSPRPSWSRSPGPGGQSRSASAKNEAALDHYQVRQHGAGIRPAPGTVTTGEGVQEPTDPATLGG
jgi:hypothetical protein